MRARCRGFTLIEVMVALAIVTLGVAAMLGSMTSAANNAYYLRDKTFAEWVALNRIAEVRLQKEIPKKGKTDGEGELAGRKWDWQQDVQPMQLDGAFQIEVSVRPHVEGVKPTTDADKIAWYATVSGVVANTVERGVDPLPKVLEMSGGFESIAGDTGKGTANPPPNENTEEADE